MCVVFFEAGSYYVLELTAWSGLALNSRDPLPLPSKVQQLKVSTIMPSLNKPKKRFKESLFGYPNSILSHLHFRNR